MKKVFFVARKLYENLMCHCFFFFFRNIIPISDFIPSKSCKLFRKSVKIFHLPEKNAVMQILCSTSNKNWNYGFPGVTLYYSISDFPDKNFLFYYVCSIRMSKFFHKIIETNHYQWHARSATYIYNYKYVEECDDNMVMSF